MGWDVEGQCVAKFIVDLEVSVRICDVQVAEECGAAHPVKQVYYFGNRVFINDDPRVESRFVILNLQFSLMTICVVDGHSE